MKTTQIKNQIKKIAKEFGLKYKSIWFNLIWINSSEETILEYISECQDPIYNKYGKTIKKRITNIERFINSDDFKHCLKRYGGQVISKNELNRQLNVYRKIKNNKLRLDLVSLGNKIRKNLGKGNFITLLTKTKILKEKEKIMKDILRHEWIHVLLKENNINFKDINKRYWPYDEGLDEYMVCFIDGNLNKLEKFRDSENYPLEKKNWIYAIKFKKLFRDKDSVEKRRKSIFEFIEELK